MTGRSVAADGDEGVVQTTRAVVAHGAGDLRVESRPVPEVQPGEALVEIAFGGICGSDVHYFGRGGVGDNMIREPLTLGHEVSGRVLATVPSDGPGAGDVVPGTAVSVHPATPCRTWSRDPVTPANLATGVAYLGSAGTNPHTQGAFSDLVVVRLEQLVILPEHLDLRRATLAEPLGVALHAVRRAGGEPTAPLGSVLAGRSVAVVGCGPIGALVVAASRAAGAASVAACDLSSRALEVATAVGAHAVVDVSGRDPIESAAALVGSVGLDSEANPGFDVVIESSGSIAGLVTALHAARRGGVVVGLGLLPPGDLPIPVNVIVTREITFLGSFRFVAEIDEAVELLAAGLPVGPVLTHELEAHDAVAALRIAADPSRSSKVLLRFAGASGGRAETGQAGETVETRETNEQPVVVLGLMGAGKTTLARAIAADTGRTLRDSDRDIERATGRNGREIAAEDGVEALHTLEVEQLLDALDQPGVVVAAAAAVVESSDARHALSRALVIWLDAPAPVLAARLHAADHRRDIADPAAFLDEQRTARAPRFAAVADLVLDAGREPADLARTAIDWLGDRGAGGTAG